jgi:hypothetical protein
MGFKKRAFRTLTSVAVAVLALRLAQVHAGFDLVWNHNNVGQAIPFSLIALSLSTAIVGVWLMLEGVGYLRRRARKNGSVSPAKTPLAR